jgi:2-C-methyl-D-erythritol 4-phosphate cytidylyltransferase
MRISAIIAAAGRGKRVAQGNKLLISIGGKPVLAWTLEAFENHPLVEEIVLVTTREDITAIGDLVKKYRFAKVGQILPGGEERQDSVYSGLTYLEGAELVAVHDGARPLVSRDLLDRVFEACREGLEADSALTAFKRLDQELEVEGVKVTPLYPSGYKGGPRFGGAILALPALETVKRVERENFISSTLNRNEIWMAQTPQVFIYDVLLEAHKKARESEFYATDDAALVERLGCRVKVVVSSAENIKITTTEDVEIAEILLRHRLGSAS